MAYQNDLELFLPSENLVDELVQNLICCRKAIRIKFNSQDYKVTKNGLTNFSIKDIRNDMLLFVKIVLTADNISCW